MRFQVDIAIKGGQLTGDHALSELRHMAFAAAGHTMHPMLEEGVTLLDWDGEVVGMVRLVPDWAPGDLVWATTHLTDGPVKAVITSVVPDRELARWTIWVRNEFTSEPLGTVQVDQHGHSAEGRPLLGRVR